MPANSSIDIHFPAEYKALTDTGLPTCSNLIINSMIVDPSMVTVSQSGSAGSLILKISGGIPSDLALQNAVV